MKKNLFITQGALIAALYVILTFVSNAFGLANGAIQLRLSEALTILPCFTPAAIPGLFVGCLIANLLTDGVLANIIVGSLATLAGAVGTYCLRKLKWLAPIPTVISNTVLIPFVLMFAYGIPGSYPYFAFTVFAGEILSAYVMGILLHTAISKSAVTLHN